MPVKKDFSDRMLRALKPAEPGKRYVHWDAAVPGLGIRVTDKVLADRIGSFVLVIRFPGSKNPAPRTIGDYPATPLTDARNTARQWREDVRRGVDPAMKAAQERRAREEQAADTFEALLARYAERKLSKLRTGKVVEQVIRRTAVPRWGKWPVADIKRRHVIQLIEDVAENAPINANRLAAYLKTLFKWIVDQDRLETSPAASVKRPSKESKRDRVLTDTEMLALWEATADAGAFGRAMRIMLVTAQRRTEVGAMRWSELDFKERVWRLPQARTKAARAHEVPLSDLALEILNACPRIDNVDFVFTSGRAPRIPNADGSPNPISGWGKSKDRVDAHFRKRMQEAGSNSTPEGWRLHDLRRTAATGMSKLGTDRIVIARILNHADREVTAIYDRHRYDNEKREALQKWATHLSSLIRREHEHVG